MKRAAMQPSTARSTLPSHAHDADVRHPQFGLVRTTRPRQATPPLPYVGGSITAQRVTEWGAMRATLSSVSCASDLTVELTSDAPRISLVLEKVGGTLSYGPLEAAETVDDGLVLVPADTLLRLTTSGVSFLRHLVLDFDQDAFADLLDTVPDLAAVLARPRHIRDSRLIQLCELFADECDKEPLNRLYADGLVSALLGRLSSLDSQRMATADRGALAPWQLRRMFQYFDTHLAEALKMSDLAELSGLSLSYFNRAFRVSTGKSPHQYLLERRCERAKELLIENRMHLSHIALEVGFCDQAHFTRIFGRCVGSTPGAWRRDRVA